jgi:hypothetical protein
VAAAIDLQPVPTKLKLVGGGYLVELALDVAAHKVLGGAALDAQEMVVVTSMT